MIMGTRSLAESDILYENPTHWVLAVGSKGFEVYRKTITHSVRCASIGHGPAPQLGLTRALAEADRRHALTLR
jgi:hypothetical protein